MSLELDGEDTASATAEQSEFRESMTAEELSDWLLEQGLPNKYCKVFESKHLVLLIIL